MPIISRIGRKSLKVRLLIIVMYTLLIAGASTMVYPFWLMVVGTTKTAVDTPEAKLIPEFYVNDTALYKKYLEGFFNEKPDMMNACLNNSTSSFRTVELPKNPNRKLADEWRSYIESHDFPFYHYGLSFMQVITSKQSLPVNLRKLKAELVKEYDGNLELMNRKLESEYVSWNSVFIIAQDYLPRRFNIDTSPLGVRYEKFKEQQPVDQRYYFSPEGYYKNTFLKVVYTKNIESYNKSHNTNYKSWDEVYLPRRYPEKGFTDKEREDWIFFIRTALNLLWIRADKNAEPLYREFLKTKYDDKIEFLNKNYETSYKSFDEISLIDAPPVGGLILSDWDTFIQGWKDPETGKVHIIPPEMLYVHSIDFWFRNHLKKKYGTIDAFNTAMNTSYKDWHYIFLPQLSYNYFNFKDHADDLKWEFTKRNFISVFDFIVLHGRGIINTIIYCTLQICCALIVNPLAAYALSRYKPPSAYKVLLFLMLTMAFPPMVTQIPVFLMLREFHLLNTFAALILPGMANGYSIFLLKGFFDSLPQELYESAEIDGAGEFRIFWQITMSLSKPILAVIALNAFTMAYANFMMALLICQDEKMWTLMPWLYQLQQRSCQGVIFTSLIIAAVPTFLIFAFCQNIIMRGIVVPVEK